MQSKEGKVERALPLQCAREADDSTSWSHPPSTQHTYNKYRPQKLTNHHNCLIHPGLAAEKQDHSGFISVSMGFPGQLISTNNQTQEEHGEKGSIISNLSWESWFVKGWTGTRVETRREQILLWGTDGHCAVSLGSVAGFLGHWVLWCQMRISLVQKLEEWQLT